MRISDWSSDVCSSDLGGELTSLVLGSQQHGTEHLGLDDGGSGDLHALVEVVPAAARRLVHGGGDLDDGIPRCQLSLEPCRQRTGAQRRSTGGGERDDGGSVPGKRGGQHRSEEHTTELQSIMRSTHAFICSNNKTHHP